LLPGERVRCPWVWYFLRLSPNYPTHESIIPPASTKTNGTGLLKDSRHTEDRRTRHRDGRLLRGGIGLTTGLGWSDRLVVSMFLFLLCSPQSSEDEGAPSALTRRLSTLDLSRCSSSASFSHSSPSSRSSLTHSFSMRSVDSTYAPSSQLSHSPSFSHYPPSSFSHRPGPLTRSLSSGTLVEYAQERDDSKRQAKLYDELDEWGVIDANRWSNGSQTLPHPSNLRKSTSSSSSRTSSSTASRTRPRKGSFTGGARSSGGIGGVGIPEDQEGEEKEVISATKLNRIATSFSSNSSTSISTTSSPSTASTLSIPPPITPQDSEHSTPTIVYGSNSMSGSALSREKSLPPLPPSLRRVSGKLNLYSGGVGRGIVPRATTPGAGADATDPARSTPSGGLGRKTPSLVSPRPLRLASLPHLAHSTSSPQLAAVAAGQAKKDRPAVPVPAAALSSSKYQLKAPAPIQVSVDVKSVVPSVVEVRPKPRTGTGMVYRSGGPSRLRLPSTALGSSFSTGGVGGRVSGGISVPV